MRSIPSLNGFRAISIMIVTFYHFSFYRSLNFIDQFRYLGMILLNGALGVNIFFIISGFLITTLLKKELDINNHISLRKFYIRRIIRIFPAYYFLLLVYYILQNLNILNLDTTSWLSALTYTKQFFQSNQDEVNHLWSLSVEEIFYLIWPLVFINYKKLNLFIWIFCLVILISRIIFYTEVTNTAASTADALLIGCLLAINYKKINMIVLERKYIFFLTLSCLFFSILIYNYFYKISLGSKDDFVIAICLRISYGLFGSIGTVTNILLAILITFSISKVNLWFRFLNSPIINHVGKLSYSIYLWQQFFICNKYFQIYSVFTIIVFIAFASLFSYYLIEKPFLNFKQYYEVNS